jgi:hypothetical protein
VHLRAVQIRQHFKAWKMRMAIVASAAMSIHVCCRGGNTSVTVSIWESCLKLAFSKKNLYSSLRLGRSMRPSLRWIHRCCCGLLSHHIARQFGSGPGLPDTHGNLVTRKDLSGGGYASAWPN